MSGKPHRGDLGGAFRSAVARLPQGDVGGPVFGRAVELDQAAANPVWAEFRAYVVHCIKPDYAKLSVMRSGVALGRGFPTPRGG